MKQALNLETRMQGSIRPRAASRSVGASPFGSSRESRGMASSERESYLLKLDESNCFKSVYSSYDYYQHYHYDDDD